MKFIIYFLYFSFLASGNIFSETKTEDLADKFDDVALVIREDQNLNFIILKGSFKEINQAQDGADLLDVLFSKNGVFLYLRDSKLKLSMQVPISGCDTAILLKKGYAASLKKLTDIHK